MGALRSEIPKDEAEPRLPALVRLARPKQWIKNVLVVAAPGAAGVLGNGTALARTAVAFVCFCLAASGTYFINDANDAEADRLHPTKRHRPIAAGHLEPKLARAIAVGLIVLALAITAPVNDGKLTAVIAGYLAVTFSYTLWLKHEPVIDLAAVAAGFVFRAIAGGAATGVPLSDWFLIVAGAGSLFVVTGKRHAELVELGTGPTTHRRSLDMYSSAFLNYVRAVASSVTILAYCLWAFEKSAKVGTPVWFELSIVPFVLGILRYALLLEHGQGGAPEDVVLSDRVLLVLGAVYVLLFGIAIHGT
jgi:decaprenyl-phosphate phosphoribosyltransferase